MKQIQAITGEIVNAARKRRQIARLLKQQGLLSLGKGAWLSFRDDDIVSGLLIEGSPTDTYLTSFLLPIFDECKFVSFSLGRRLVHCSAGRSTEQECAEAINSYRNEILPVRTADDLISYLDSTDVEGFYPLWVRYICLLRNSRLEQAELYLDESKVGDLHMSLLSKLEEIRPMVTNRDIESVQNILNRWEVTSRVIFGNGSYNLEYNVTR